MTSKAAGPSRPPRTNRRCEGRCRVCSSSALRCATAMASAETSVAVTAQSPRSRLMASAMAPEPVPRSSTRAFGESRRSASSTSNSVSGRGISTAGDTPSVRVQNSRRPVMYATGVPPRYCSSALRRRVARRRCRAVRRRAHTDTRGSRRAHAQSTLRSRAAPRRKARRAAARRGWSRDAERGERFGLMFLNQRLNHFLEMAFHDLAELVERQIDAVVGQPPCGKLYVRMRSERSPLPTSRRRDCACS